MENVKILVDGIQKDVLGLFYIFDSKYYFIYTEKELDENNYVILYMSLVGKETKNTENGAIETGAMIGVEITDPDDQKKAQTAVSYIVEDKKNNTVNPQIKYLPITMLKEMKIISKKRFRLLKTVMEENFKLDFSSIIDNTIMPIEIQPLNPIVESQEISQPLSVPNSEVILQPSSDQLQNVETNVIQNEINYPDIVEPVTVPEVEQPIPSTESLQPSSVDDNVIIDYRSKYFEEQEKNKELQVQINTLIEKIEEIKKVIS